MPKYRPDASEEERAPKQQKFRRNRGVQPTYAERVEQLRDNRISEWDIAFPDNGSDSYRPDFG